MNRTTFNLSCSIRLSLANRFSMKKKKTRKLDDDLELHRRNRRPEEKPGVLGDQKTTRSAVRDEENGEGEAKRARMPLNHRRRRL